jgi:poly [ADP-ribose] polymerase
VTGYFLGKGAYFADMVSVSGQYLHTSTEHPVGLMLLCDVALGRTFQLAHGKFVSHDDLSGAGFHSLKVFFFLRLGLPTSKVSLPPFLLFGLSDSV